jgi:hypothetical protein
MGLAWEGLISMALENDLFWLPTLQREASSGTIIRDNLLFYSEEFCQEDVVPCKAANVQEFLIVWKMEVTVEWQGRSKIFNWPKVKIFRHWWGNKEEREPNDIMEVLAASTGAFYDRLKDRFHLFVIKAQETERSIWCNFKMLFKTHDVSFKRVFQIQMMGRELCISSRLQLEVQREIRWFEPYLSEKPERWVIEGPVMVREQVIKIFQFDEYWDNLSWYLAEDIWNPEGP